MIHPFVEEIDVKNVQVALHNLKVYLIESRSIFLVWLKTDS